MKKLLLIAACLASLPAYAHERDWYGPAVVEGVVVYEPVYPYPYRYPYYPYYYPYAVAPPATTTVAPQPPAPVWYYCESQKAYFPYVNSCAEGWKQVPATPPDSAPR